MRKVCLYVCGFVGLMMSNGAFAEEGAKPVPPPSAEKTVAYSPQEFVFKQDMYEGVCQAEGPAKHEGPYAYAVRITEESGHLLDIDCVEKHYRRDVLSTRSDFVSVYVSGITSYKFIQNPCESEFRKTLIGMIENEDRVSEIINKDLSFNVFSTFYSTAYLIEKKCGASYRGYFRRSAEIGPIYVRREYEVPEIVK